MGVMPGPQGPTVNAPQKPPKFEEICLQSVKASTAFKFLNSNNASQPNQGKKNRAGDARYASTHRDAA